MHSWPLYIIVISLPAAEGKKRAERRIGRVYFSPAHNLDATQHNATLSEGSRDDREGRNEDIRGG